VLTHTIPALFVCDAGCFAELEAAGVVAAGAVEEEVEVGFAELGAAAGVAVVGGLSEVLDCGDWACSVDTLKPSTGTRSVEATSRARDSFLASRFIVLFLAWFCFSRNACPLKAGSLEFRHDGEESG